METGKEMFSRGDFVSKNETKHILGGKEGMAFPLVLWEAVGTMSRACILLSGCCGLEGGTHGRCGDGHMGVSGSGKKGMGNATFCTASEKTGQQK